MKTFLILACIGTLAFAEPPSSSYEIPPGSYSSSSGSSYAAPAPVSSKSYGAPPASDYGAPVSSGYGAPPSSGYGAPVKSGQTFKHIYVHSAPDEGVQTDNKVIRVPGGNNKHVNIIFVKTPSSSSQQQTEVILPEQDQQKNIVYVLLKKPEASSDVKIRAPTPSKPTKPEVYFIKYSGAKQAGGYGPPPTSAPKYGAPVPVRSEGY